MEGINALIIAGENLRGDAGEGVRENEELRDNVEEHIREEVGEDFMEQLREYTVQEEEERNARNGESREREREDVREEIREHIGEDVRNELPCPGDARQNSFEDFFEARAESSSSPSHTLLKDKFKELNEAISNTNNIIHTNFQKLLDHNTKLERLNTRLPTQVKEHVNSFSLEILVALGQERKATTDLIKEHQAVEIEHRMRHERLLHNLIQEVDRLRQSNDRVDTYETEMLVLKRKLATLRNSNNEVVNTVKAMDDSKRKILHFFQALFADLTKGKGKDTINHFGQASGSGAASESRQRIHGEPLFGVPFTPLSFTNFSNPSGTTFSTFVPKVIPTGAPGKPNMTEQDKKTRMFEQLTTYSRHSMNHLFEDGRTLDECERWFQNGVFHGDGIHDAYDCYMKGVVKEKFFHEKFKDNFKGLRKYVNDILDGKFKKM